MEIWTENFKKYETVCLETGRNDMVQSHMDSLQAFRDRYFVDPVGSLDLG